MLVAGTGFLCFSWHLSALAAPLPVAQTSPITDRAVTSQCANGCDSLVRSFPDSNRLLTQMPPLPGNPVEPEPPTLPPLPESPLPPTTPPALNTLPSVPQEPRVIPGLRVWVTAVDVVGSTAFSADELAAVVAPFEGKEATFEDLLAIRTAVTDLYTRHGYTTSGAFLPPQDISDGRIVVQVIEGVLERVEIEGLRHLQERYVRDRIALAAQAPLNIQRLEQALQLLQVDPLFSSVQAELAAGTSPGLSILKLNLREAPQLRSRLVVENRDSPSVGSIRYSAAITHQNLLGIGDRVSAEVGFSEGIRSYDFNYALPLNARNGTLSVHYTNSSSAVVEDPFDELEIEGRSQMVALSFRQPIVRTPANEFSLGLSAEWRQSRTFLFDDLPFSFSEGPDQGESKVSVLRFSQDWVNRTPNRVLAARSQFSVGLDVLGATINDTGTDGRFFSWVGQFQYVQALGADAIAIARISTQLTPDSLLPLEQFSIGGADTVRGYRQNLRVADNGVLSSLEIRVPIIRDLDGIGLVQLTPFIDVGSVWNNFDDVTEPTTLASAGLGLRWQWKRVSARLDWGLQLNDVDNQGDSLQDNGLFFQIQMEPF